MPRITATKVGTGPDGADIFRPIIVISIETGTGAVEGPALLDSGADNTLVPAEVILPLGIRFVDLPAGISSGGVGGGVDVRACSGTLKYAGQVVCSSFMVSEPGKGMDIILLGRSDFFAKHVVRFLWHKSPPLFDVDPVK